MAKAIAKLKITCNNKPIKNMKQYRDNCKHFLMNDLNADAVKHFYKYTHFVITVAAFDFKPFWHKQVVINFLKESNLKFEDNKDFSI
eukprot:11924177-Ditylum_brightwellii.AAC.1